jgi:DUF1365 family protein
MQSSIYEGQVSHARAVPVAHAFRYRLFMLYLDLAELPGLLAGSRLWSAMRPALAWFRRGDYLGDPREPLDESVRRLVERATGRRPAGPIRLLTHPRYFGYGFNPVSFYYCFAASDEERLEAIVAEVRNTPWGERHCYVLEASGAGPQRFTTDKALHVSPFMPMDLVYDWTFSQPGRGLAVRMALTRGGEHVFTAALDLQRRALTQRRLARMLVTYPFMTLTVIAGIYWQALKLKLRGCPSYDHPAKALPARSP